MFKGIHDISSRDKTRDWSLSKVKTGLFDVAEQPVPAYQNPWELAQMLEVYNNTQPWSVLELGPYHGGTLWHFIKHSFTNIRVGAVDFFDEKLGSRAATPTDWERWANEAEVKFRFFEGNTHDPEIIEQVNTFFPLGIEWLFIDANHSYEDAKADFQNYGIMVPPGGVIGIHDIRPKTMGTYQLWEEIRNAGYVTQQIVADPYNDTVDAGIGLVFV